MIRRLTSEESQQVFRILLEALANPGRPVPIGLAIAHVNPVAIPVLALADLEVTLAVAGSEFDRQTEPLAAALERTTGTRRAAPSDADLVVMLGSPSTPADEARMASAVAGLRRGDALHPERGARLFLGCANAVAVAPHTSATVLATSRVWLTGPGVPTGRMVDVVGVPVPVFEALQTVNQAFPAGVDAWLVAGDGAVVGIPRSCRIEVVAQVVR